MTKTKKILLAIAGLLIAFGIFTGYGVLTFLIVTPIIVRFVLGIILNKMMDRDLIADEDKNETIPPFLQLVFLVAFSIGYFYILFQYLDHHYDILL